MIASRFERNPVARINSIAFERGFFCLHGSFLGLSRVLLGFTGSGTNRRSELGALRWRRRRKFGVKRCRLMDGHMRRSGLIRLEPISVLFSPSPFFRNDRSMTTNRPLACQIQSKTWKTERAKRKQTNRTSEHTKHCRGQWNEARTENMTRRGPA